VLLLSYEVQVQNLKWGEWREKMISVIFFCWFCQNLSPISHGEGFYTTCVFGFAIWKPESSSQDLKQTWFIGSSCSSSHMGLLLLAPLVCFLTWGCFSFPLAMTFFSLTSITLLPLLFFSLYCHYSSFYSYYFSQFIAIILLLITITLLFPWLFLLSCCCC